ncbi:MAG: hypothetical protein WCB68_06030 [Pyrinomonadaceae bacterium]
MEEQQAVLAYRSMSGAAKKSLAFLNQNVSATRLKEGVRVPSAFVLL